MSSSSKPQRSAEPQLARDLPSAIPVPAERLDRAADVLAHILDPALRGGLYPYYARLRELDPVHKTDDLRLPNAWVLSRFADVDQVLRDRRMISNPRALEAFDTGESGRAFTSMLRRMTLYLDPPDHARVRGLVSKAFTPRSVEKSRPLIQSFVDGFLDEAASNGGMDLIAGFAYPLPILVICGMLGVPPEDLPTFREWAVDFGRRGDIGGLSDGEIERGERAAHGFGEYFARLIEKRRRSPKDDLVTALARVEDAGVRLTDDEIVANCVLLLQAGHSTTADLIGNGAFALLRHRDQLEALQRRPELLPHAVEELLRFDTSVQVSQRVGSEDSVIGGVTIPAGEVCILLNGAANRDPARFDDPERLDLSRPDPDHVSFGLGAYVCLGKSLARAEIESAIGSLVRRFPELDLTGDEVRYKPNLYLWGLEKLQIKV